MKNFIKKTRKNIKKEVLKGICATGAVLPFMTQMVYATDENPDVNAVLNPLIMLKTLVTAIIAVIGVIILAKNVMEFAQAFQQQDTSSMNVAIKGIVAGALMAAIGTVLSFLGF